MSDKARRLEAAPHAVLVGANGAPARSSCVVTTVVGMSGLRLDGSLGQAAAMAAGIAVSLVVSLLWTGSRGGAVVYVTAVSCVYYVGHFAFFRLGAHLHHMVVDNGAHC